MTHFIRSVGIAFVSLFWLFLSFWATEGNAFPTTVGKPKLSQILVDSNLTGLDSEKEDVVVSTRQSTLDWIKEVKRYRNSTAFLKHCEKQSPTWIAKRKIASQKEQEICLFATQLDPGQKSPEVTSRESKRKHSHLRKKLKDFLVKASQPSFWKADRSWILPEFKEADSSDWNRALHSISRVPRLELLIQHVLSEKESVPSALPFSLGLRVENEFPEDKYRSLSWLLYEKASEGGQDTAAVAAAYRLGLMKVWSGHCDQAEKILSKIPDGALSNDYKMRAMYWRYHCAEVSKNEELKTQMRSALSRQYPLSLHTLLANYSEGEESKPPKLGVSYPLEGDPEISFRTESDPQLNQVVRIVEMLLSMNQTGHAIHILNAFLDRFQKTDPSFQLYVAVLFKRAGMEALSFQIMANIFRGSPQLISHSTLRMMYPLQNYEVIQDLGQGLDPYLIISLIRQESAFDKKAKSSAGAFGLMQLQLATARTFERIASRRQLLEPKLNIRVGTKYLMRLLKRYEGSIDMALVAYNAGPERLKDWMKRYPTENRLLSIDLLPVKETRDYVSSIIRNYYWYLKLYSPSELEKVSQPEQEKKQTPSFLLSIKALKSKI